jgi:hypothetical protein
MTRMRGGVCPGPDGNFEALTSSRSSFATGFDRFDMLESWNCDYTPIPCDTGFVMTDILLLRGRSSASQETAPDLPFMVQELALELRA